MRQQHIREQIIGRASDYRARAAQVRDDPHLSPLGKKRQLEALYQQTKPAIDELREQLETSEYSSRQDLERRLFGLPAGASASDAISYRDATDRVMGMKRPEELGELMERAAASGDTMLLRAGFAHAHRQSRNPLASELWGALVDEYGRQNPDAATDLTALTDMTSSGSATTAFAERLAMDVPRPKELDKSDASFSDKAPERGNADRPEALVR